ncbi:hypothetical protein LJC56_11585 [Christensenellaceae bacterium OttesenSCG-928-K19]|nr:hypothetical protein [Christensenellaceae bacterium OttesenSCG-928-K19]
MFFDFKPSKHDWINKVSNDYMSYKLWEESLSDKTTSSYSQRNNGSTYYSKPAPVDPADTAFYFVIAAWAILGIIFAIVAKVNIDSWVADLLAVLLPLSPVVFIFAHIWYAPSKKIIEIPAAAVMDRERVGKLPTGYLVTITENTSQNGEKMLIAMDRNGNPLFFIPDEIRDFVLTHMKNDAKFKCQMLPPYPWTAMKIYYTS